MGDLTEVWSCNTLKIFFFENFFLLLSTCMSKQSILWYLNFICLLSVGNSFKTFIMSVDLGKAFKRFSLFNRYIPILN